MKEPIQIGNLLWDTQNIEGYYTFDEAKKAAEIVGKRLPTDQEFKELCKLPHSFKNNDLVFENGLNFKANGYRKVDSVELYSVGSNGNYWSSCKDFNYHGFSGSNGFRLTFNSSHVTPASSHDRSYGFSVRCVKDIL
jgi:uncharacterized protein (TIGR02145 family)